MNRSTKINKIFKRLSLCLHQILVQIDEVLRTANLKTIGFWTIAGLASILYAKLFRLIGIGLRLTFETLVVKLTPLLF